MKFVELQTGAGVISVVAAHVRAILPGDSEETCRVAVDGYGVVDVLCSAAEAKRQFSAADKPAKK